MRVYTRFRWKNANYRISSEKSAVIKQEIKHQRAILEKYIEVHKEFLDSLVPVELQPGAPDMAARMAAAARYTRVGPMAAVAGAIAQAACEAALRKGSREAIVENGGDIFLVVCEEVMLGIYTGRSALENKLAFRITPEQTPLAVCSSSSRMGHSLSFGNCDLACVVARDGALADAAATMACNSVKSPADINTVLEQVMEIPGIIGILIAEADKIGLAGKLPEIVRNYDASANRKITRDPHSADKILF